MDRSPGSASRPSSHPASRLSSRPSSRWSPRFSPADLARARAARAAGSGSPAAASGPIYLRIAGLLAGEIRRGRLRAGDRLPSTRELARMLAVNRNTAVAAYDELASEGWIAARPAAGAFVNDRLPDVSPRRFAAAPAAGAGPAATAGFDMPRLPPVVKERAFALPPGGLGLWGGFPDLSLLPVAALARAYRRAVLGKGAALLEYTDGRGHPRLRAAVAGMLSATRGLTAGAGDVMITRGSQMAVDLAARALFRPGDVVAVEELGYPRIWAALQRAGAELVPVPVDAGGVDVDALAALVAARRVRGVYLTPHHQYPTTVVLAPARRMALLELARKARLVLLEDDYDHEFHFDGQPVMPLGSADAAGVVVYVGTLSKILAPGLRLGLVVAPRPLLERMVLIREAVDRQGDSPLEAAVADLIEDGELQRHARRMRRLYRVRRDVMVAALRRALPDALSFEVPPGGMSLWARAAAGIDVARWSARAAAGGVGFVTGRSYVLPGDARARARWSSYLRIGYARYEPAKLEEAVRRMAAALAGPKRPRARRG